MTKRPSPEEYEKAVERLLKNAPAELQNDREIKDKARVFLELGGETLARQYLRTCQKPFPDRLTLFDKPPEDEVKEEGTEDPGEETEDLD